MIVRLLTMWYLQGQLVMRRLGWINCGSMVFLCLCASVWLWGLPHLRSQAKQQEMILNRLHLALQSSEVVPAPAALSPNEEKLKSFYDALGEASYMEQQVKTLFAIAEKNGLSLNRAEYKLTKDRNGRYSTYQAVLPLKGPYSAVRQFSEQTLIAIPFASLDEIHFKRDAIGNRIVDARVRMTLYFLDLTSTVKSSPTENAAKDIAIFALQSRETLIGGAHTENVEGNLFGSQSWAPPPMPPPKPPPPPPLPPPTAPPLPFTYLGKKVEGGVWEIYLARGDKTYIVREQTVIDDTYRADSIKPPALVFTYLPMNKTQTLAIGGTD